MRRSSSMRHLLLSAKLVEGSYVVIIACSRGQRLVNKPTDESNRLVLFPQDSDCSNCREVVNV